MQWTEQKRNRLSVLKMIRHHGPVTRSQLPELTGLSSGTVSGVTADLVQRGLVLEARDESANRGRPRVYLSINSAGAVVIGAAIDGIGILTVAFVDLSGRLLHSDRVALEGADSLAGAAEEIARSVRTAIAASPFAAAKIARVGVALPAIVNSRAGTVLFMTTFPRDEAPFAQIISHALGIPTTIENDMVVMARAEHWFGRAQALDTFTLINFGFSLGSARYVEGLPWSGANGITTELAHTKISWGDSARPCYCGARGCASAYSSIYGVLTAAGALEKVAFPPVNSLTKRFSRFLDKAESGDGVAVALLREAGARLGQTVANHINAADPGEVLVLLSDPRLGAIIAEDFQTALVASVVPGMLGTVAINFAVADGDWRWKGTAALALEHAYLD